MFIIESSSNINDIKKILTNIKSNYPNISFISYVDGEFGLRMMIYSTIVNLFVKKQKENNQIIVGLCFKGLTFYIKDYCDFIIEINDSTFSFIQSSDKMNIDNSAHSLNHYNGTVSSYKYNGNDGWNLFYIRGIHNDEYEKMLDSFNFSDIFYTTHCDGSRYINKNGIVINGNISCGKIKNQHFYFYFPDCLQTYHQKINKYKTPHNDNICVWIRNTNKHPSRNMSYSIYNSLFNYCIQNKKRLYIFLDLIKVEVPQNEYLIICDVKMEYSLNLDNFLEVCKNCSVFICTNSGITDIVSYYLDINVLLNSGPDFSNFSKLNGVNKLFTDSNTMIKYLDNIYYR